MELNKIYCMDNLELLKQLPNESISLIYCDILYNTGKKFKDYDDRLGTPQEAMEWYKPRLIEMKRVLKNSKYQIKTKRKTVNKIKETYYYITK